MSSIQKPLDHKVFGSLKPRVVDSDSKLVTNGTMPIFQLLEKNSKGRSPFGSTCKSFRRFVGSKTLDAYCSFKKQLSDYEKSNNWICIPNQRFGEPGQSRLLTLDLKTATLVNPRAYPKYNLLIEGLRRTMKKSKKISSKADTPTKDFLRSSNYSNLVKSVKRLGKAPAIKGKSFRGIASIFPRLTAFDVSLIEDEGIQKKIISSETYLTNLINRVGILSPRRRATKGILMFDKLSNFDILSDYTPSYSELLRRSREAGPKVKSQDLHTESKKTVKIGGRIISVKGKPNSLRPISEASKWINALKEYFEIQLNLKFKESLVGFSFYSGVLQISIQELYVSLEREQLDELSPIAFHMIPIRPMEWYLDLCKQTPYWDDFEKRSPFNSKIEYFYEDYPYLCNDLLRQIVKFHFVESLTANKELLARYELLKVPLKLVFPSFELFSYLVRLSAYCGISYIKYKNYFYKFDEDHSEWAYNQKQKRFPFWPKGQKIV